jgi:AsmA-like C-terminal region/AsmA family/Domain of Unknown Function (DUF748)
MTPQRLGRKLVVVLLGLVVFVLLVVALLPYVVSLDSVRDQIVGRIEAALQRKVEVGAVRLQILSGLGAGLEDVTIYNPPGWEQPHLLKAATLSVKVAWRPLLQRRIQITRMILRDGEVVIERDAQGRLNLAGADSAQPAAQIPPPDVQPSPGGAGAQPGTSPLAGLRVADVTLQRMSVTLVDRLVVPGQAIATTARDLELHLRDVALGAPIPIDMAAAVLTDGGRNVRLRGHLGPIPENFRIDAAPVDVRLETSDVRLDRLAPYLGPTVPLAQGRLGGEFTLQGSMAGNLRLTGNLSLADAALRAGAMSDTPTALPPLTSTQAITVDLPAARADLTEVAINVAGIQALIKGTVHTFTTTPQLDLQLATNQFQPAALLAQVPALAAMVPKPTDVRGAAQLQATLKGAPQDLRSEAQIDLRDMALKSGSFNGGDPAGGGMLLETDQTAARLATHLVPAEPPQVHVDVQAQRLVFDQQAARAPAPAPPAPAPDARPKPATQTAPAGPALPPVTLSGQVRIAQGRIQHVNFQQLTADISLANGLLKTTHRITLYGGTSQGTTQVDLTQAEPSHTVDARVAGLNVGQVLDELTPAKNTFQGRLDADIRLSGRGFAWEAVQKHLSGDGHVKVAEVQLTQLDFLPQLLQVLQNIGGLVGFTVPGGWEHGPWRTIETDWRLREGKILTDRLRLRREGVEALLSGYIGLDQAIDYTGTLFLPVKVTGRRGAPVSLRQDDSGRLMLPFTVHGTVSAPRVSVDEKALIGRAPQELVDTVRKHLGGKIDELLGQPSAPKQPGQEPEKPAPEAGEQPRQPRGAEKILRDLFRR